MEKHRCKLCYRRFANGRALGGHMRSHMANLPIPFPSKPELPPTAEIESFPEPSSSSSDDDDDDDEGVLQVMRENPKKSIKLADLEDRESETESTRNPTRQRSKRRRKPRPRVVVVTPLDKEFGGDASEEVEPVSSISEVASEEEVAFCLMMLSRDKWTCHGRDCGDIIIDDDVTGSHKRTKKYRCETCNKVFRSYQALGGHRASHKKTRVAAINAGTHTLCKKKKNNDDNNNNALENQERKSHECPVCFRVFGSGQALGGHKRSHGMVGIENDNHQPPDVVVVGDDDDVDQRPKKLKRENIFIDLNLPAPVDDGDLEDEISQIAVSAVSDAHF